ncbi:hypothetical protein PRNP1_012093 [Phytophthora ramorum]
MTGLSYEKLDDMTFVEAADQFKLAAMDESTLFANLEIEYHAYFVAIIDTIRKVSDPEFTCYWLTAILSFSATTVLYI